MKHLYAMRLKPFSVGIIPKEGLIKAFIDDKIADSKNYSLLLYDKKLSEETTEKHELEYLGEYEKRNTRNRWMD